MPTNKERAEKYKKFVEDAFNSAMASMDKDRVEANIIDIVSKEKTSLVCSYLGIVHRWTGEWKVIEGGRLYGYLQSINIEEITNKILEGISFTPTPEILQKYKSLYIKEYDKYIKEALIERAQLDASRYFENFVKEQLKDIDDQE